MTHEWMKQEEELQKLLKNKPFLNLHKVEVKKL
jgi:hypothetical protein